jgi:hypothetical protein
LLRAWWCADLRHAREPRCARGVRWTRQQPGLSAMRRLFCAQSLPTNSTGAAAARLCLGATGAAGAAVYEGSASASSADVYSDEVPSRLRSGGGIAGSGGRSRRQYSCSKWCVLKLMVGLLALAAFVGWSVRHHLIGRRAALKAHAADVHVAEELPPPAMTPALEEGVVSGSGAAARRRAHRVPINIKRPRAT